MMVVIILVRLATYLLAYSLKPRYFLLFESYKHQLVVATSTKSNRTEVIKRKSNKLILLYCPLFYLTLRTSSPKVGRSIWFRQ